MPRSPPSYNLCSTPYSTGDRSSRVELKIGLPFADEFE